MWQTGNQIAARCKGIFLNLRIILWPNSSRKSQTDFRNVFWHVFHTLIKNDAAIVATALIYALSYKQKEMAEFIIESDANVNSTINNLETLLHFALMLNHEEFVLLLLQNGPDDRFLSISKEK